MALEVLSLPQMFWLDRQAMLFGLSRTYCSKSIIDANSRSFYA